MILGDVEFKVLSATHGTEVIIRENLRKLFHILIPPHLLSLFCDTSIKYWSEAVHFFYFSTLYIPLTLGYNLGGGGLLFLLLKCLFFTKF